MNVVWHDGPIHMGVLTTTNTGATPQATSSTDDIKIIIYVSSVETRPLNHPLARDPVQTFRRSPPDPDPPDPDHL